MYQKKKKKGKEEYTLLGSVMNGVYMTIVCITNTCLPNIVTEWYWGKKRGNGEREKAYVHVSAWAGDCVCPDWELRQD